MSRARSAWDPDALARAPLPAAGLRRDGDASFVVDAAAPWLRVSSGAPTFVALRNGAGVRFARVQACEPERDVLALEWLAPGATPLDASPATSGECAELSLAELIEARAFAPPLPMPGRVLCATLNFESHLRHDLAVAGSAIAALARSRPRLIQRHPALPPPGSAARSRELAAVLGAFDDLRAPASVVLPDAGGEAPTFLDCEAEIAAVLRGSLPPDAAHWDDAALLDAVAGFVLATDGKPRNHQVYLRARGECDSAPGFETARGHRRQLGAWNTEVAGWWGHAAGLGELCALGPFLRAAQPGEGMPAMALLAATARAPAARGNGAGAGRLELRQGALVSADPLARDPMVWSLPALLRAAAAPGSLLLPHPRGGHALQRGDVVCLGTPAGVALRARPAWQVALLRGALFWWTPRRFHDAFFASGTERYLRASDELFLWADGLGCQRHRIVLER